MAQSVPGQPVDVPGPAIISASPRRAGWAPPPSARSSGPLWGALGVRYPRVSLGSGFPGGRSPGARCRRERGKGALNFLAPVNK